MVFQVDRLLKQHNMGDGNERYAYVTADTIADVNTAGYFNDAINTLKPGDLIDVVQKSALNGPTEAPYDQTVTAASIMIVLTNDGTNVDVSDGLVIPVTDSD